MILWLDKTLGAQDVFVLRPTFWVRLRFCVLRRQANGQGYYSELFCPVLSVLVVL
jgi:accessory gene regulator protein AgrB